jgi:CRP-like cAMP-binding protein
MREVDLSGNLGFLNLGELLQLVGSSGASGTLHVISPHRTEPGMIFMDKGNPINATNGALSGMDALFSLFGWTEGRFEFTEEPIGCEKTINKGRMEIILDSLRLLDEGKIETVGPKEGDTAPKPSRPELPPLIRGPLVDYSYLVDEEGFYDGDEIVREGAHGNWIWVILEGTAEIIKTTANGPLKILRVGDGAFLGSLSALLSGENVRSSTVIASGNIQLGMLDSQLLAGELANLSTEFKSLVRSLDNRLRSVTEIAAQAHAQNYAYRELVKGKKIAIKEGQNEERLFRIRDGEVVVARNSDPSHRPLARLRKGDYFGHIPFLTIGHEPFTASVFASPDIKLTMVDSLKLENEYRRLSATLRNIIEHLAACISATTLITTRLFNPSG